MSKNKSDKSVFRVLLTIVLIGIVVVLSIQNSASQEVKIFFWSFSLPLFVLLFLSFVIGILLMFVLLFPKSRRVNSAEAKIEKLENEIIKLENKITSTQSQKENE